LNQKGTGQQQDVIKNRSEQNRRGEHKKRVECKRKEEKRRGERHVSAL
jgi:hypothetical protein